MSRTPASRLRAGLILRRASVDPVGYCCPFRMETPTGPSTLDRLSDAAIFDDGMVDVLRFPHGEEREEEDRPTDET